MALSSGQPKVCWVKPGSRFAAVGQAKARLELLGQRAAHALADEGVLGVQFDTGLVVGALIAVLIDAEHAGDDALHRAVFVVDDFGGGHAGIDLDTERLGVGGQRATDIAQRGDVVAVVQHPLRERQPRDVQVAMRAEDHELVAGDLGLQRNAELLPVRQQLIDAARIDHRAGQNMSADFGALLQTRDRNLRASGLSELLQADSRRQPRRPGADDHDVVFHRFAFNCLSGDGFAHDPRNS